MSIILPVSYGQLFFWNFRQFSRDYSSQTMHGSVELKMDKIKDIIDMYPKKNRTYKSAHTLEES